MSTGKRSGVLGWFWMGSGAAFYPPGIWARGLFGLACQWAAPVRARAGTDHGRNFFRLGCTLRARARVVDCGQSVFLCGGVVYQERAGTCYIQISKKHRVPSYALSLSREVKPLRIKPRRPRPATRSTNRMGGFQPHTCGVEVLIEYAVYDTKRLG